MKTLSIDIETYSSIDLAKCGVYRYVEATDFEITLFGYSVDSGKVVVVDLINGEKIPREILLALSDVTITKWAFNAAFERICLSRHLGLSLGSYLSPQSWRCTRVWAATLGLPLSLTAVASVMKLEAQKLSAGKELIRFFCQPCTPTKSNGGRTRNLPHHAREKWNLFKAYNQRDVEVEMAIQKRLARFPVPDFVWEEYQLDQRINDRGVALDETVVENAVWLNEQSRAELMAEMKHLTNLDNPNSVPQMKRWLAENGLETKRLDKKAVTELLKNAPALIAKVLALRGKLAKSSVKKYAAMQHVVSADGRARGMFQFYGANRTGRFAGRLIQLQNLPQNHLPDLKEARDLVKSSNVEALKMLYEDVPDTLSQLIRTAFVPQQGYKFIVADFSAIEARVITWFAGESWRAEVFAGGGDIYCASASQMFGVPVEKHGVNAHLRQKGKIAELALGYGGSVGALKAMGALDLGLEESELPELVSAWRKANPHIVKFWREVDGAIKKAVKEKTTTKTHGLCFEYLSGMLFITLPSGRKLSYVKPAIAENRFGGVSVTYEGLNGSKKWQRLESYGAKFVENIVQATARDLLMVALKRLSGYRITMHIHDEIVLEVDEEITVASICREMCQVPDWAAGLKIGADGYECGFYRK